MSSRRQFIKGIGFGLAALSVPRVLKAGSTAVELAVEKCPRCHLPEHGENPRHSATWYEVNEGQCGDFYYNTILKQFFFHHGTHWSATLPCPACIFKLRRDLTGSDWFEWDSKRTVCDKLLSTTINTVPDHNSWYPTKWRDECCCGHPWLATAMEDYALQRAGESDAEYQERRRYPSIPEWFARRQSRGTVSLLTNTTSGVHPLYQQHYTGLYRRLNNETGRVR